MSVNRAQLTISAAALAIGAALLFAPAHAQNNAGAPRGIPCRVSWHDVTHGGDWSEVTGSADLTQIAPDPSGGFVAIGNGEATVSYHSSFGGCHVIGSPWIARYMVTVESEDDVTADVDISGMDESHEVELADCLANGHPRFDVDSPGLPTVNVQLHEGETPFSEDHAGPHGNAGDEGTVTLHYCSPEHPSGH